LSVIVEQTAADPTTPLSYAQLRDLCGALRDWRVPLSDAGAAVHPRPLPLSRKRKSGAQHHFLHTLRLKSRPNLLATCPDDLLLQSIDEVTKAVGLFQAQNGGKAIDLDSCRVHAIAPHWLASLFQIESGSPAGKPVPPPAPDEEVVFPPDEVDEEIEKAGAEIGVEPGSNRTTVHVAIIDSWPMDDSRNPLGKIQECHETVNRGEIRNRRLAMAAHGEIVPEERIYDLVNAFNLEDEELLQHGCDGRFHRGYRMPDHGLFIADLIHQIAPGARISVYRAVADAGSSSMEAITAAVNHAVVQANGAPLVLNFSFGIGPELRLTNTLVQNALRIAGGGDVWKAQIDDYAVQRAAFVIRNPGASRRDDDLANADILALLLGGNKDDKTFASYFAAVDDAMGVYGLDNVLAIAASGNDSCRKAALPRVFGPRLPAAIEGIIGVSAHDRAAKALADFSNDDDFFGDDDGTSAFGGEAKDGLTTDGLIGLFVSPDLPPGNRGGNSHGRAMWSGTSFAAPIVTGIAARLWADSPPDTPSDKIREIIVRDPITLMQYPAGAPV
jgi:hypothetical protein